MFIIIHNKLINKCYFGMFGKHSVFGNGDVSNRKPNLRNCCWGACVTSEICIPQPTNLKLFLGRNT